MMKLILNKEWKTDEASRQAGLKYMNEHPYSAKEWNEQVLQNEEIRKQNMKSMQHREECKKDW